MRTTTRRRRLAAASAAAALTAVLAAGCAVFSDGGSQDAAPPKHPVPSGTGPYPDPVRPSEAAPLPSGKSGEPQGGVPSPGSVDGTNATAVSRAALTVLATYDTAIDASRNDAGRRAADAGWCTATYAGQLREAVSRSLPGADWETWASHRAYTKPRLTETEEAGRPSDTDTTAYRQWTITLTPTGRDGWTGSEEAHVAYAELTRTAASQPWRLNAVTIQ